MRLVSAFALIVAATSGALAQSASDQSLVTAPKSEPSVVREAPIGHRQPTLADLPKGVLAEENDDAAIIRADKKMDHQLIICSRCE